MKTLNFAIIGAGNFGKNYARVLSGIPGAKLVAVTAQKKESLVHLRKSLASPIIATNDINVVLENPKIDCAIIATPPSTHFAIANKAIENGKHVLLEKPMVVNLEEAGNLKSELQKNPVTFMVGHQYVYNDYVNFLKNRVIGSGFGQRTKYYFGEHFYNGPIRNDASCLQDAGTHQLSVIQHLFNPGELAEVHASSASVQNSGRDDFMWAGLTFQNGLHAMFALSWVVPQKTRRIMVAGEKLAIFDDVAKNGKLKIYDINYPEKSGGISDFMKNSGGAKPFIPRIREREPLMNELSHFVDCIRAKKEPATGINKSVQITAWLDKIGRAMEQA